MLGSSNPSRFEAKTNTAPSRKAITTLSIQKKINKKFLSVLLKFMFPLYKIPLVSIAFDLL